MRILPLISLGLECEFPSLNKTIPKSWGIHTQAQHLAVICKHEYSL